MTTIKGPGIFLAQFLGDKPPFNTLENICEWAAGLGFKGVQIPTWDARCINLPLAAESKTYADELKGLINSFGLEITELSTHLQGQLVAVHPAYDQLFDSFAPDEVKGNPAARTEWAVQTLKQAAKASANLGLNAHATFSGALLWPYWHPWHSSLPVCCSRGLKNWVKGGNRYWMCLMKMAWMFATKFTLVKICMMGLHTNYF